MTAKDETFIRELYAEHGGALLRFALHLTGGDRQKAEDLVQETVLRFWTKFGGGTPPDKVRPWLFAVLRNKSVDAYRARQSRPPEVADDELLERLPAEDPTDRALRSLLVTGALGRLKPDHVAVIVELYYRGRSVTEAAAALGIPPGTVKSRSTAALKALAAALQEQGVTGSVTA